MTDQEINVAIAEACEWEPPTKLGESWWIGVTDREVRCEYCGCHFCHCKEELGIPNYCADLNAMHEAEKQLSSVQRHLYHVNLSKTCSGSPADVLCHATARQRAEEFCKTVGKWKGQVK